MNLNQETIGFIILRHTIIAILMKKEKSAKIQMIPRNFYNSKHDINNTPNYNANNKNRLLYSNPSTPSLHGRLKNKKPKLEVIGGNNLNDAMMLTIDFK